MKNFWEKQHEKDNLASLSGHPAKSIINGLYIKDIFKPGMTVLEVGVGLGICTRDLYEMKCSVSVVDISPRALDRVKDITSSGFLDTQIEKLPEGYYDLAISYCVAQHMNNAGLANQLKHVIRSLKPGAIFAMQYAIPFHKAEYCESDLAMQAGAVCRPIEMIYEMVDVAGGRIAFHRIWGMFPQYQSGWVIAHITRKEA